MRPTSCFSPRMSRHSLFFCLLVDMTFLLTACSIAGSKKNHPTSENGKLALLTSGRPAFQQHVKRAEGSDTTPRLAHAENHERRMYKSRFRQKKKDHAAQRGRDAFGTATRISASLSRRLSAFFESTSRPRSQSGKVRRSNTRPGDVGERAERSEGSDTTLIRNDPCFSVCAVVCDPLSKGECVPAFTRESERGAFVPEVLKTVWTMCWKRWYDCVSCAFRSFFEDEKESRINGWRRNRRSAQSLLPAVRAVDGGFNTVGCGVF